MRPKKIFKEKNKYVSTVKYLNLKKIKNDFLLTEEHFTHSENLDSFNLMTAMLVNICDIMIVIFCCTSGSGVLVLKSINSMFSSCIPFFLQSSTVGWKYHNNAKACSYLLIA